MKHACQDGLIKISADIANVGTQQTVRKLLVCIKCYEIYCFAIPLSSLTINSTKFYIRPITNTQANDKNIFPVLFHKLFIVTQM